MIFNLNVTKKDRMAAAKDIPAGNRNTAADNTDEYFINEPVKYLADEGIYIFKNTSSYFPAELYDKFKDVEVVAEGDGTGAGITPEIYDLCKKALPLISELDETARAYLPRFFKIPEFDPSCWCLERIELGPVSFIDADGSMNGLSMYYTFSPENAASCLDSFQVKMKFQEPDNKNYMWPIGLEFGPM